MSDTASSSYFTDRLEDATDNGDESAFTNDFKPSISVPLFRAKWSHLENSDVDETTVQLTGRIVNKRDASKKLIFLDVQGDSTACLDMVQDNHFQVFLTKKEYREGEIPKALPFDRIRNHVNRGDVIGVVGYPTRTTRGELSVMCHGLRILTPCLHEIPRELEDRKLIDSQRYLHFIVNKEQRNTILVRSRMISAIRKFLDDREFLEVETPTLEHGSGANAAPFVTEYNALETRVNLRVAPELALKRAVIAGFGKVYEIGRQYRNEGMDPTHNPEFTTLEFYQPYADLEDLMTITEQLLHETTQLPVVQRHMKDDIDWVPPYARVYVPDALVEKLTALGVSNIPGSITGDNIVSTEDEIQALKQTTLEAKLALPTLFTVNKLIDNLISELLEPDCKNPTFLYGHPLSMSPLAKPYPDKPNLAQRFELFVNRMELCNAYAELNNPVLQRDTLAAQMRDRAAGDDETIHDESYCVAMEYGLPPTAGWGMGIDRLVMMVLGIDRIGDTMLFQLSRAANSQVQPTPVPAPSTSE